jgi:hypothetical protein
MINFYTFYVGTHNEEFCALCCPPNVIGVIKLRRIGWVGRVACLGNRRSAYRVLVGETGGKETTRKT